MAISVHRSIYWQKDAVLKDGTMIWDRVPTAGAWRSDLLAAVPAMTSPATQSGLMWHREMALVPTGKFASALEETGGQKFYTAGYLKLYSEDVLTCSKIAPCIVFLIRPGGLHLQRKHQFHLFTKHRDVYCLVLRFRRGPGPFTAGACDKWDNIN